MTKLIIVRHGQTDWNLAGRWQGAADIPLNAAGLAQAEAAGNRLRNWDIDVIYSSPLKRAKVTAETIAKHHNLPVILDNEWRERHAGDCEGMTHKEIRAAFPGASQFLGFGTFVPPNGESAEMVAARIIPAFKAVTEKHAGQNILVVSHGGSIGSLVEHILGLTHDNGWRFASSGNTGIGEIVLTQRGWRLIRLNDTAHLENF